MAENSFNLNAIWKAFSSTGNETLSLSIYQGAASFVMFKKGSESRRPVVKMTLSLAACLKIADTLKALLDAQPETRMPFVQMQFNKEARTHEPATSFVFFKDEKRCYGIEISNKFIPTPIKVVFRCPNTFSTGHEALSEEQKSTLSVSEFITIMTLQVPQAMLLSRYNMEPPQNRGKKGYGGGNRQQQSQPSRDPYGPAVTASDDVFG